MAESKDIKVSKKITREEWKRADAAVYRIMRKYKNKSGSDPDFVRELQAANPHHPSYNLDNLDNLGKLGKKGDEKAKNQKVTTTEEKTPEVTPEEKTPVRKTEPINANIFNIPLGEKKTPVEKTKPKKPEEVKTHVLSRVYTKPSKVQEMHRRLRKGGKSFTRQGASKLIDKTDKLSFTSYSDYDHGHHFAVAGEKTYRKDLTSGGSRGSALTATGGNSITKQMELYRQNRKRKKKGR